MSQTPVESKLVLSPTEKFQPVTNIQDAELDFGLNDSLEPLILPFSASLMQPAIWNGPIIRRYNVSRPSHTEEMPPLEANSPQTSRGLLGGLFISSSNVVAGGIDFFP